MESNKKVIRALRPEEIEIRVSQISEKGVQLLLYKDSRCDKKILDETFGIMGWKNKYEEIKGNLFCTISIFDKETNQWIEKCDCGVESRSDNDGNEKKGEASDAFKRAGFAVGIGRELYTRIFYFAKVETKKNAKGKYELADKYMKFSVKEIETNEDTEKIEKIKIVDKNGKVVFSYGYDNVPKNIIENSINKEQIKKIHTLIGTNEELKNAIYKKFKISSSKELTESEANEMINVLSKGLAKKKKDDTN